MSSRKAQLSSGSTGNNRIYDLGPFRLDVANRTLSQSRIPVRLGLHAVEVRTALVERAPEFVPKATIMDAAWRNVIVEESNLTTQIYAIRRVFAQVPGGDRWIETLARRGYRYAGPVSEVAPNEASSEVSEQSNLPTAQTSFVGRERELRDVKRLLSRNRFLTISGIGGIGKTRLALQVASEVLDAYRH